MDLIDMSQSLTKEEAIELAKYGINVQSESEAIEIAKINLEEKQGE